MTVSVAPLVEVCASLGITADRLAAVEDAATLSHTFTVTGADAASIDPGAVQAAVAAYGTALRIEVRTDALSELVVAPGVTRAQVAALAARSPTGGPYNVVVQVDKAKLIPHLSGDGTGREVCLFLFAAGLARVLARGLARFESEVWAHAPAPLVVAVADTDIKLHGPLLSVLGGSSLPDVATTAASPAAPDRFGPVLAARDRHVSWDGNWTERLTPWHFALTGECADETLLRLLRAQVVKLLVLFTCDRARSRTGTGPPVFISAEFRGSDHAATVVIDESAPLDVTEDQAAAAVRIAEWCYARSGGDDEPDWVVDRLPFVQARLAQALHGSAEQDQIEVLVRTLPFTLEGIEWQWKGFISGRLGEYLSHLQQVETAVADVVTSFADRSAALAKAMVDALLAALVVVVGSLIAAAFKDPFNETLFRVGVLGYAVYVVVFPGLIGLVSSRYGLRAERLSFDGQVERFKQTVDPAKVDDIVGDRVSRAQRGFYRWLALSAAIYLAVGAAAVVGSEEIPAIVAEDPAQLPSTTDPAGDQQPIMPTSSTSAPAAGPTTTR